MAETTEKVKKAKAPAKPRAAATRKSAAKKTNGAAVEVMAPYIPTHQEIAILAEQYWIERGCEHGQHVQDWLRAEQDLARMAS